MAWKLATRFSSLWIEGCNRVGVDFIASEISLVNGLRRHMLHQTRQILVTGWLRDDGKSPIKTIDEEGLPKAAKSVNAPLVFKFRKAILRTS